MNKDLVEIKDYTKLKQARVNSGQSQVNIARHCGVSVQTVYRWESGLSKKIEKTHMDKLHEIMNIEW